MSRSGHQRHQQKQQQQQSLALAQQQMADNEAAAAAAEMFDLFCVATTMRQILGLHRNMCDLVGLRPAPLNEFYPKLKAKVRSWRAQALWKKFDARAAHRAYVKGNACTGTRVLVIGAGPCGLRTAIEAQLLGAKVVVVEKRDRISRNNVLHLWPFVITDLRNLGAKKFYGKFCAGSIDHISIRQLQCILLKVALLLGVEIHEGVSFESTVEPSGDGCGWRAAVSPADHAVSHYEFDVLIGADGKRNTLEGFKRKEFRGKLAIAITANFINKKTEAEAKAEEISGVAFIFNQSFFKELYHTTGIDLENIVYYKDETHYFVMTAKKHSLIDKGVILQDFADPAELLAPANVNTEKLLDYAREAAEFSTKYQMPNLEFAVNHYGKPDVAMFDFTSMFAAEASCRVVVRRGFRLLQCLVGDSLLEPFWPTGSGCARGFLSSMDAAYAIKLWSNPQNSTLGVVAQRESIYRLLNQTTPENLQRDIGSYTVDPATRYPNLNRSSVNVWQVKHLIDTDDKAILEQTFMDTNALQVTQVDTPVRRKRRSGDSVPLSTVLLRWIGAQLRDHEFVQDLKELSDVFSNGKVLCALIHRYRPDLIDFGAVKDLDVVECNELAFRILEKDLHIPRIMSGKQALQLQTVDSKIWLNYLEQICEVFRGEIPHVKHPKIDFSELREKYRFNSTHAQPDFSQLLQISSKQKAAAKSPLEEMMADVPHEVQWRSVLDEEKLKRQRKHEQLLAGTSSIPLSVAGLAQGHTDTSRRARKRRNAEKAANIEERQKRLQDIEQNRQERMSRRRQQRYLQTQNFYKSLHMLQVNTLLRESEESLPFEDYSIFLYRQQAPEFNDRVKELERKLLYPDRERGDIPSALPRAAVDEQFSDRIRSMEQRISSRGTYATEKKPKDLMRAIGKIESSDWNVREIEKKIEQSKKTEVHGPKGREKVPKWSKEQFQARQHKMSKPMRQNSADEKFKEIDQTLKNLDKQLKEGSVLEVGERGRNKVASIAGQFVKRDDTSDEKNPPTTAVVPKSSSKVALAFKKQAASEKCHFCKQTVYLMEKVNTEGLVLHRSCLKCHHCHTNLRLGSYAFDRDDPNGRFYCTQHFRLPAKAVCPVVRKPGQRKPTQQQQLQQQQRQEQQAANLLAAGSGNAVAASRADVDPSTPDKLRGPVDTVAQLDLLDRGQTPERIEFENTDAMSDGEPSEEHIIDEHEWSGRNFLPESNNDSESDLSSSDESESESDSDIFEEANDFQLGAQTLQLATDWIGKQNYSDSEDSDDFYDSSDGNAEDDGKDDTEGEEFKKARELRREEVRLLPLPANLPTDTETEKTQLSENKENISIGPATPNPPKRKDSKESFNSEQSLKSTRTNGSITQPASPAAPPTKADIEKLEQGSGRRFSAEVEAISEKLYRLNNVVKMSKDLETLAKEDLVRSDILKKLSMKEKWLADNNVGPVNPLMPKSKFSLAPKSQFKDQLKPLTPDKEDNANPEVGVAVEGASPKIAGSNDEVIEKVPKKDTNKSDQLRSEPGSQRVTRLSGSSSSPSSPKDRKDRKMKPVSRSESLKKPKSASSTRENSVSGDSGKDMGRLLYKVESKFSPEPNRRISAKLKEIETQNFSGTMNIIKSQMVMPTVSAQAAAGVDLSKYFPIQTQPKSSAAATNKNQKNLKDVDLTKYFPNSPVPQKRSSVVTVADRLKKSQTEKSLSPKRDGNGGRSGIPKRQASLRDDAFSLRDHQLDGAVDLPKRKSPVRVDTEGNVNLLKNPLRREIKTKKASGDSNQKEGCVVRDASDGILDELLQAEEEERENRSSSSEYQKLFKEEKSPSDDLSDKIERILEETGIVLDSPPQMATTATTENRRRLLKTKSLGEGEFRRVDSKETDNDDRPGGVQNLLKRFESMSSVKSDEQIFKLRRMESTTNNLNKSKESLVSRESDTSSDLDKTLEYLKSEWRSEATNFLQRKRDNFYAQKGSSAGKAAQTGSGCESKIPKFLGLKQKSPDQQRTATKKRKAVGSRADRVGERTRGKPLESSNSKLEENLKKTLDSEGPVETSGKLSSHPLSEHNRKSSEAPLESKSESESEMRRSLVEDIRNLPKTGCDKSLSNSRRASQASLESRRLSDAFLAEQSETTLAQTIENPDLPAGSTADPEDQIISENIIRSDPYDRGDSLCTSISKSPSVAPTTVQLRGSSEDESIEKLFSQFSDEMLVNVEFDSNDELVVITPRATLSTEESHHNGDHVERAESLERDQSENGALVESIKPPSEGHVHGGRVSAFPMKPQRRSKSKSSSSESAVPIAPQRIKKRLAGLCPTDMPPSVQDILHETCGRNTESELVRRQARSEKRFPSLRGNEEDHLLPLNDQIKTNETNNRVRTDTSPNQMDCSDQTTSEGRSVQPEDYTKELRSSGRRCSDLAANLRSGQREIRTLSNQAGRSSQKMSSEGDINEFSKVFQPKTQREDCLCPDSPMPKRKASADKTPKSQTKENQSEIEVSNPARSRQNPESNSGGASSASSAEILNNTISQDASESAVARRRLIEEFEKERRQALIQRDRLYQEMEKPELKPKIAPCNGSGSEKSTSLLTPSKQSPRNSARSSQQSVSSTTRGGSPPMTKTLEIPSRSSGSSSNSRRSSFAFIESLDIKPVTAPMPKKLQVPLKGETGPPANISESVPESFKNRPWPTGDLNKAADDKQAPDENEEKKDDGLVEDSQKEMEEYANLGTTSATASKRQWPDGKTIFKQESRTRSPSPEVNEGVCHRLRLRLMDSRYVPKRHSETPESHRMEQDTRPSSGSATDLRDLSAHSRQAVSPLSRSSVDSEYGLHQTRTTGDRQSSTPPRSARLRRTDDESIDSNTRRLLDRSRHLHNRKCDFVNERVLERNPYMRTVINGEKRTSAFREDPLDELGDYRRRRYASSPTTRRRFPSSRSLDRGSSSRLYGDSLSSTYSPDYGSNGRYPSSTLSTLSWTLNNHRYQPTTSTTWRPDDYRQSSPQPRETSVRDRARARGREFFKESPRRHLNHYLY